MKLILTIFLFILPLLVDTKKVTKKIRLSEFHKEGPFIFLTKMHLGTEGAQYDLTYNKGGQISSESFYNDVAIGILNASSYEKFMNEDNCHEKQKLLYKKDKFNFKQQHQGMKHLKIQQLTQKSVWFFYVYSCNYKLEELTKNREEIQIILSVLNDGSHFDQDDLMLPAYIAILVIWLVLVLKFAVPIANLLSLSNPNAVRLIVYGGLLFIGTAYLYRLIHLILYWSDGAGIHIFQILYLILKNVGEAIITTMLVAISWGWTIVHLKPSQSYIIIGAISGLINIICLILSSLTEQHEQLYHSYDTVPGTVVLVLRIVMFLIFLAGIIRSIESSSGKILHFIKKLGWIAGIYLISWPLTVLIVELIFPSAQHKNIIVFTEQLVHICSLTLLCHMISDQQSSYRKVSLHEDDNPLNMGSYKTR